MKLPVSFAKVSLTFAFFIVSKCITAQYVSLKEERIAKSEKNKDFKEFHVVVSSNEDPQHIKLVVTNPNNELLFIQLKNEQNKIIQDDIFYRRTSYNIELNTTRLEDGIYALSIKTNLDTFERNISIETKGISSKNNQMVIERDVIIHNEEHRPIASRSFISTLN